MLSPDRVVGLREIDGVAGLTGVNPTRKPCYVGILFLTSTRRLPTSVFHLASKVWYAGYNVSVRRSLLHYHRFPSRGSVLQKKTFGSGAHCNKYRTTTHTPIHVHARVAPAGPSGRALPGDLATIARFGLQLMVTSAPGGGALAGDGTGSALGGVGVGAGAGAGGGASCYLLVVEKDAVFQRLAEDRIWDHREHSWGVGG
jgi:hypothetical protein